MERRWLLSVAYLHLCLLYSSVGQTPDNNEGQYSNYEELTFSVVHASLTCLLIRQSFY